MSSPSSDSSLWSSDVEKILNAIAKNCVILSRQHKLKYFYLQRLLRFFKLPCILLSSVNAVFSVSLSAFITQDRVSLLCSLISLITTIITSIELYLQIEKHMMIELEASKNYQMLYVEIIKVLTLDRNNRNIDSQAFLDKSISEYQKLYDASCILENNIKDELSRIYHDPLSFKPSYDELDIEKNGSD
jgi:hypothetical protein